MATGERSDPREPHPGRILREHGVRPRHALGQNFLASHVYLGRIVKAARPRADEAVLEIGTGLGRLTARLARRAGHVLSVEIDPRLYEIAKSRLEGFENVTLLCCDFLASKHSINPVVEDFVRPLVSRNSPLKVVSNLPFCISSPAIVNLLEWDVPLREMYLTVQKEVADRLTARPGKEDYGPLSVVAAWWARVERLFHIPRRAFWPQPEVSAALVRIEKRHDLKRTAQYDTFLTVMKRLFENRRKMLGSILRTAWDADRAYAALEDLGIPPTLRADQLDVDSLWALAQAIGPPRKRK